MINNNQYIAIMAGGIGSRFWPASREKKPKQFLDITGSGTSLLQQTVARLKGLVPIHNIYIVTNYQYSDQILAQLPLLSRKNILLEPTRNNTAPCVAYTALHLQSQNPEAVFAVLPADHIIKKVDVFESAMRLGFEKASKDNAIVTLGIQPTRPDTGYGYIHYDHSSGVNNIYKVSSFKEKPTKAIAEEYISQKGYVWNAGIFIWSCKTVLNNFAESAPQITEILSQDISKYGSSEEQQYINKVYPRTDKISVDYAILETAKNIYTIPVDIGWSDLGTWNSLYSFLEKDTDLNVSIADHKKILNSSGNLIRLNNTNKLVVIKGLKDYIVIDEDDVLLIYPRNEEQEVKSLKSSLQDKRFE